MSRGALATAVVQHHLRLFGLACATDRATSLLVVSGDTGTSAGETLAAAERGAFAVCLQPSPELCRVLGIAATRVSEAAPLVVDFAGGRRRPWRRLRTLHPIVAYEASAGEAIVEWHGKPAWLLRRIGMGAVLLIGTDLPGDLMRYRQGDPARVAHRPTQALWGIAGERPVYLFEEQLAGEAPHERHADWWAMALAETVSAGLGIALEPMLPQGAPGAIVLTGDDDQAYLEKYEEQLALIGKTPITYFLHPLTRHTPETLQRLGRQVDLGLHPDALDAPDRYGALFEEQCAWFARLTRDAPFSVRNHGFLNDGYWRHADAWLRAGVRISSNVPGADGRVLNGSLLPARLALHGELTPHWSLLTAVGDGVRFALGMSDQAAGECVLSLGERVLASGLPGVIVLNLHPQNVSETRGMHRAALELVRRGFLAWNLRECCDWFERRDGSLPASGKDSMLKRVLARWRPVRA